MKTEMVGENRTIRGLESKLQLLQVDLSSMHDQLHATSLENVRMQRELVTLRRDKLEMTEEVESLKQKLTESKQKENQFQPKITELTFLLSTSETKIQSQVPTSIPSPSLTLPAIIDLKI
jgi:chromosome segregation ATPase